MQYYLPCAKEKVQVSLPDNAIEYTSVFPYPTCDSKELVLSAIQNPIGSDSLLKIAEKKANIQSAVVVVSDITRPIPYADFLLELLSEMEAGGIRKEVITILIATGMHRTSTDAERREMFGDAVVESYTIIDHVADDPTQIASLEARSWSGQGIELNRHFIEADFKVLTGLVEPHFMAGFSGGRKSVFPGIASLNALQNFHGYEFLSSEKARNVNLNGNPLHRESLSVAQAANVDFTLNVVLNGQKELIAAFAGDLEESHEVACDFVRQFACCQVSEEVDLVISSSGGYPLDETFYQCVKGMVSCLPAVKPNGKIVILGGAREGIGGAHYIETMKKYSYDWREFIEAIQGGMFIKDQWQFQMHCRVLEKIGKKNLVFVSPWLAPEESQHLNVTPLAVTTENIQEKLQAIIDDAIKKNLKIAIIPQGPYCVPVCD